MHKPSTPGVGGRAGGGRRPSLHRKSRLPRSVNPVESESGSDSIIGGTADLLKGGERTLDENYEIFKHTHAQEGVIKMGRCLLLQNTCPELTCYPSNAIIALIGMLIYAAGTHASKAKQNKQQKKASMFGVSRPGFPFFRKLY